MIRRFAVKKLSSFQIISLGFLAVILCGALLLMIPFAAKSGKGAGFMDALFTSASAVCVTGLVVQDTALFWSPFGQAVILLLIQIGGLGIVTVLAFFAIASGRKISLLQRSLLKDSFSAHQIGGVVRLTVFLFKVALIAELAGTLLLLPSFCSRFGPEGIWLSLFHAVSAFCNAGFDLMGSRTGAFSSMTSLGSSPWPVTVLCLLIIVGGLGFLTWDDVVTHRFHIKKYRMQSKVALSVTGLLILVPSAVLFFGDFSSLPFRERLCLSLFQAVTPRTAGFNTADMAALSGIGRTVLIVLMLIGGSPGSTAGGIKTTTAAVLFSNALSVFKRKRQILLFGRRVGEDAVRSAATLLTLYLTFAGVAALIISAVEKIPVTVCLFETVSAIGTVGLSLGITPGLGPVSRLVLIALMYTGRVGGLTLIYAAQSGKPAETGIYPMGKIIVG